MKEKIWGLIVCAIGGVHKFRKLWIIVHDNGLTIAWRQLEKFNWRLR